MPGYRIGKVFYHNFGPFKDQGLDFDFPGLTVIEGQIEGMRGCDSNGAGKSFLFDGVAWALYGRCIREKYKGDDVIRLGSKGGCIVQVELVGGPVPIIVTRYRKDSKEGNTVRLKVNGKDKSHGTSTATTELIASTLGMDFTSFCNSVAFGVREDIRSFFAAPDAERKKILQRILGLELYVEAEKVARQRVKKLVERTGELTAERTWCETALSQKGELLEKLNVSATVDDIDLEMPRLKIGASAKRRKAAGIQERIDELNAQLAEQQNAYDKDYAAYRTQAEEHAEAKVKAEKEERKVEQAIAEAKGSWKAASLRLKKSEALKGKKCPTCTQVVPLELSDKVGAACQKEMKQLKQEGAALGARLVEATSQLDLLEPPEEPAVPSYAHLLSEEIVEVKAAKEDLLFAATVEDVRAKEMGAAQERLQMQIEDLDVEIAVATSKLQAVEDEEVGLNKQLSALEFWVEGFGNQGLKSFLIEAEIPEINKAATEYAQRLICPGAQVRLTATKTLKTKDVKREELTVDGMVPNCTNSYAGASKGQKKRMDLALILAFRQLVASRQVKAFHQLFADELFDGVDKTGTEAVCELLQEIAEDCPVMLVTHNAAIKPLAERVVLVCHDGKHAMLKVTA